MIVVCFSDIWCMLNLTPSDSGSSYLLCNNAKVFYHKMTYSSKRMLWGFVSGVRFKETWLVSNPIKMCCSLMTLLSLTVPACWAKHEPKSSQDTRVVYLLVPTGLFGLSWKRNYKRSWIQPKCFFARLRTISAWRGTLRTDSNPQVHW